MSPESIDEVADLLAGAAREGRRMRPVGGGRASPPAADDRLPISTEHLRRVLEHRTDDLTITVEGGCRLEELGDRLREQGQFVALDPYGGPGHTVGGVIAAGWSGPQRLAHGSTRAQVLGLTLALPRTGLARVGGRQLKNVSGYDLTRLQVGARGALGVIVEATLRVRPLPRRTVVLGLTTSSAPVGLAAAGRALAASLEPLAVVVVADAGQGPTVLALFGGPEAAVTAVVRELGWPEAEAGAWDAMLARRSEHWARLSVPPSSLPGLLPLLSPPWLAEPGTGVVQWLDASDPVRVRRARAAAAAGGGRLELLVAPPSLQSELHTPPSAEFELIGRLRAGFDPDGVLDPGEIQ